MLLVTKFYRGSVIESFHIGYATAVNENGEVLFSAGDPEYPVFTLGLAKPFQVVPLLEDGGIDKFKLSDEEIAVMCSDHNGEAHHVEAVSGILKKLGLGIDDLHCGVHPPLDKMSYEQMILKGRRATALYNSCSGTHAAMLALSKAMDVSPVNYEIENHPVQQRIFEKIKHYSEKEKVPIAKDNCGTPTFFLPLRNIAIMYNKLVHGVDEFLQKIVHIITLHPKTVAGKGRFDTEFISAMSGKGISKIGSDGVRGIGVRTEDNQYIGLAIKVLSDNRQALDSMSVAVLKQMRLLDEETAKKLEEYHVCQLTSHGDQEIGRVETEIVVND